MAIRSAIYLKPEKDFSSFIDLKDTSRYTNFMKPLSFNVTTARSFAEFQQTSSPSMVMFEDSESPVIGPAFRVDGSCFAVYLSPTRSPWSCPGLYAKTVDKTNGLLGPNRLGWNLVMMTYRLGFSPPMPSVYTPPHTQNKIVISLRYYVMINRSGAPCKESPIESSSLCAQRCKNDHFKQKFGCYIFRFDAMETVGHPELYCHNKELHLPNEFRLEAVDAQLSADIHNSCMARCPRACNRSIFQMTLQEQQPLLDGKYDGNYSMISAHFQHGALFDGGIVTMMDVRKYGATDFVSNVGGALGVFVGGTMMTLVQVILFFVKCCCERVFIKGKSQSK